MSPFRPEALAALMRWRDLFGAVAIAGCGIWVFGFGGLFYQGLGLVFVLTGAGLAFVALRRMRFRGGGMAPGVVEVDEGQIAYLAAEGGGFVALSELEEIALVFDGAGRPHWRLAQAPLPTLHIPVDTTGAEALFDAFAALPGARPGEMLAALDRPAAKGDITLWRRRPRPALT
ncbi:hypothetical protein Ga0609869_001167 [Rhodovulum iodosum]|uniref:Uncharacterized protein n=1 Tax=Rhodovulum iodosum TaxID=68291 RepID=A0ABV3XR72_9RHOB|nr:hypothetical protein [Rhodovulum robiginosum]RSK32770.1 hypothetical protein EJA01_10555 [Rhodovulum robiginosum]